MHHNRLILIVPMPYFVLNYHESKQESLLPLKLLLYLAYDGAHFCGYQAQPNGVTVQQTLNIATKALFGMDCDITGCSRTDSGVHAHMFCATVTEKGTQHLHTTIPTDKIPQEHNSM